MMGERPLRVCVISPGELPVPATKGGAIETLIMSLVKCNEAERRMKLTVASVADDEAQALASRYPGTEFRYFKRSPRIIELVYHYWQAVWKRLFPSSHIMSSLFYRKVLQSIRGEEYDAVVFEGGESYGFKAYGKVFHGRLWYHVHATPEWRTPSATFNDVMAISSFVADRWRHWCTDRRQRIHVLYNGVDTSRFGKSLATVEAKKLREGLGFSTEDFIVLFCGRLFSGKGVKELVRAIASIRDPRVKLLVVGYAHDDDARHYEKELKAIAEMVPGRVRFTGYVPNDEVWKYYRIADIQTVPSTWEEGAGNICIEGMAAGLPIVATRSGGMPEYLDERCSVLVDRKCDLPAELAEAIIGLKNDPERRARMGESARVRAERFSEQAYYRSYVDLLAQNLSSKGEES